MALHGEGNMVLVGADATEQGDEIRVQALEGQRMWSQSQFTTSHWVTFGVSSEFFGLLFLTCKVERKTAHSKLL